MTSLPGVTGWGRPSRGHPCVTAVMVGHVPCRFSGRGSVQTIGTGTWAPQFPPLRNPLPPGAGPVARLTCGRNVPRVAGGCTFVATTRRPGLSQTTDAVEAGGIARPEPFAGICGGRQRSDRVTAVARARARSVRLCGLPTALYRGVRSPRCGQ